VVVVKGGLTEGRVFVVAVSVVALHIADDSFINTEPGTSAGDHVISGLVPLVCLTAAAVVWPRLRPGARAVLALLVGLFGVTVSLEGWRGANVGGLSGDDYTGLLASAAGLSLIGLGGWILWRSRRRDGRWSTRLLRRLGIGLASLVVLVLVVSPLLLAYGITHIAPASVPEARLGGGHRDVTFTTSDGLELHGWYVPSDNGAAVIVFPGRDAAPQDAARFLVQEGYGVLLFDPRGEAESEGEPNGYGWNYDRDLDAAIEFLQAQPDVDSQRIGGIGFSVGGEQLLQRAAADDDLKAVVSEGAGIRSYKEELELTGVSRVLQFPVYLSATLGTAVFSNDTPPPNLMELVPRIAPRPVLLIYAERGQGGEELNPKYFEAAGAPKQLWKTDSDHTDGYRTSPATYRSKVLGFFNTALEPDPG